MADPKYKRVLLKLGGEALSGEGGYGIEPSVGEEVAAQIERVQRHQVELAIVIGGGNIPKEDIPFLEEKGVKAIFGL